MRFSFLLFWVAAPFVVSHPHQALTEDQIAVAKTIFQQFKADPSNPQELIQNPGLLDSLRSIFGGLFGDEELEELFVDIFAGGDHDHGVTNITGDATQQETEASFTADHKGGNKERSEGESPSILISDMPSDVPSSMPSDLPSSMPSDVPSTTPIEWVDSTDPSVQKIPKDFVACPTQDGIPLDLQKAPKLTIMYGYRLELDEDADMAEIVEAIEEKVTVHLFGSVCGVEQALAVSSGPRDIPGAWCDSDEGVDPGSCFYIAGRTTLLVSKDVAKDVAPLYCNGLESIREKLSDSTEFLEIDGVVSVSSTVGVDSLVPDYCQTTGNGGISTVEESSSSSSIVNNGRSDNVPSAFNGDLRWTGFTVMAIAVFALLLFGVIIIVHRGKLARRRPRPMRMMQSRSRMDLDQYNLSPRAEEDSASAFSEVWQADESSTVIAVMPEAH